MESLLLVFCLKRNYLFAVVTNLGRRKKRVFTLLRFVVVVVSLADYFFLCSQISNAYVYNMYNGKNMKCATKNVQEENEITTHCARSMVL